MTAYLAVHQQNLESNQKALQEAELLSVSSTRRGPLYGTCLLETLQNQPCNR